MPSVVNAILAANVPAPAGPGSIVYASDSSTTEGTNLYGAKPINSGDATNFVPHSDWNAKILDLAGRGGSQGYCVLDGLGITGAALSSTGLTLTVPAGHALIDGVIEFAGGTCTLVNTATNYVWLKRGTGGASPTLVVHQTTVNEPNAVLIVIVPVSGGAATSYDLSGTFIWQGLPTRFTADSDVPGDTPAVSWFFVNRTAGGVSYLWDGVSYKALITKTSVVKTAQVADIADTNIPSASGSGLYEIQAYLFPTTADAAAGAVTLNIKFTDEAGARTLTLGPVSLAALSNMSQGRFLARLNAGNVTYGVTHSGSYGTAAYALYLVSSRVL